MKNEKCILPNTKPAPKHWKPKATSVNWHVVRRVSRARHNSIRFLSLFSLFKLRSPKQPFFFFRKTYYQDRRVKGIVIIQQTDIQSQRLNGKTWQFETFFFNKLFTTWKCTRKYYYKTNKYKWKQIYCFNTVCIRTFVWWVVVCTLLLFAVSANNIQRITILLATWPKKCISVYYYYYY